MQIHNAIITGSFSYNGADLSNVTSSNAYSASLSSRTTDLESTSSVLVGASSSFSSILTSVSSSQQQISASLLQVSASYIALSGSYNTFSGSASTRVTQIETVYATTGSNSFRANQSITGSLVVSSTITAQTLVVQTVTSSIVFSSGSNTFGNQLANNQTFTGSVNITGSLALAGNITGNAITLTGALFGTSATFSSSVTSSFGSAGANFNSNAATTGSVNAYRVSNTTGIASFGIDNSVGGDLITGGLPYATLLQSISNTALQLGTNQTARLTITSGGNVGIGTNSPSRKLVVVGGNGNQLELDNTGQTFTQQFWKVNGVERGTIYASDTEFGMYTYGSQFIPLSTNNTERMRITSAGNVGIGYNNPDAFVTASGFGNLVVGNGSGETGISIFSGTTGSSGLMFADATSGSGAYTGYIVYRHSSDKMEIATGGGTPRLTITSGGVVQIANLAGNGSRTVTADASGNLSASSDSSLKQEDINHKIEGLAEILQLQPRAYKWISDIEIRGEDATTEIGFFANEVNAIIPSAAPKGNDDLYGFYDRAVIAALVKAVQEQDAQIEELKALIAAK